MFEHFGLKDAFLAIWRYKFIIFCCSVLVAIVGGICISKITVNETPAKLGPDLIQDKEKDIPYYEVKNQFYLEYNGEDKSLTSQALSQMYLNTFQSYSCNKFVNNYIFSKMSKEEIIRRLNVDYSLEEIGFDYFEQFIHGSVDTGNGQAFTLLVRSIDEEYAALVVEAYMEWINQLAISENSKVEVVMLDKSIVTTMLTHIEEQSFLESKNLSWQSVCIVFFFMGIIVFSIIAIGIRFFIPTLNRRNDYKEYGITVLGEFRR